MNHDRIHALVARCLAEPGFLSMVRKKSMASAEASGSHAEQCADEASEAARVLGHDGSERLALFSGFITKIKHNSIRRVVPLTFRLLPLIEEELAFFAAYAPAYLAARAHGPMAIERQLKLFQQHLKSFLKHRPAAVRTAANDMLTHEITVWSLRSLSPDDYSSRGDGVIWRGVFQSRRYHTDVLLAAAALACRRFDRKVDLVQRRHTLGYWRPLCSDHIDFFEIDDLTEIIFSLVDGCRSFAEIAEVLRKSGVTAVTRSQLEEFFDEAARRGLVELKGYD